MSRLVILLAIVIGGCSGKLPSLPTADSDLLAHQKRCASDGNLVVEWGQVFHEPCLQTQGHLVNLVRTSPDCRAYWGDGGVDLGCNADAGVKASLTDGGSEADARD